MGDESRALGRLLWESVGGGQSPPGGDDEICRSCLGSFLGIGSCAYLSAAYFEPRDLTLLIGSFGASAVLVYGAVKSPLARRGPRRRPYRLSAYRRCLLQAFGGSPWLCAALAVSSAIALMFVTRTLHPPGGATALIAVISGKQIHNLGFLFAILPVGIGAVILLFVAVVVNNLCRNRKYPEYGSPEAISHTCEEAGLILPGRGKNENEEIRRRRCTSGYAYSLCTIGRFSQAPKETLPLPLTEYPGRNVPHHG